MEVVFLGCLGPGLHKPSGVTNYVRSVLAELSEIGIRSELIGVGPQSPSHLPYGFTSLWETTEPSSYGFTLRLFASNPSFEISSDSVVSAHRPDDAIPFLLLRRKTPIVLTLHGAHFRNVYLTKGRLAGRSYDFLEKYSVKRSNQLICVSKGSQQLFQQRYPGKADSIHHVPPGVDTNLFRPVNRQEAKSSLGFSEDDFIVLYAGRLEKEKRVDLLLQSFAILKKNRSNARLVLAGDGGEWQRLNSFATANPDMDVYAPGTVTQDRLSKLMNASDVLCLLSMHEGFPSVVLEALACGLPVVSTRVGDVPEVVQEGVSGAILDSLAPEDVSDAIWHVGSNRDQMTHRCVQMASGYSWREVARTIAEIYRGVLDEGV
jgi:glycosyltransferase involved in cell wall biosynthesis